VFSLGYSVFGCKMQMINWKDSDSEMISISMYNASMRLLNPTHSFTHSLGAHAAVTTMDN